MKRIIIFLAVCAFSIPTIGYSQDACCDLASCAEQHCQFRSDMYGPIGIMGDHLHEKGSLMASIRYMQMNMADNFQGNSFVGKSEIYDLGYMNAPEEMHMQMGMIGLMYAPLNRITLMAMGNYISNEMSLTGLEGQDMSHGVHGLGDLKVSVLAGVLDKADQKIILQGGISIPTGDVSKMDQNAAEGMSHHGHGVLPYPMRLGSGTWDMLIGGTYRQQFSAFSFGAQVNCILRNGTNEANFSFGNQYQINSWVAFPASDWLSFSIRLNGQQHMPIDGYDLMIHKTIAPPSDPINSGHRILHSGIGFNIMVPKGALRGMTVGVEYLVPIYQSYSGIQMRQAGSFSTGIKHSMF